MASGAALTRALPGPSIVLVIEYRALNGQASALNDVGQTLHKSSIDQTHVGRQMGGHDHAAAYSLTVQPLTVAKARLYGVAKCVAEIQDGAQTRLSLILTHNESFDFTTAFHCMCHGLRLAGFQVVDVGFYPI